MVAIRVTGGGATTLTALTDVTGHPGLNKSPVDDGSGVFPLTEITVRDDLDAILDGVRAVNWVYPTLLNGFQSMGPPWAKARYRLALNNTVYVEGLVTRMDPLWGEDAPVPIFELTSDCLPGGNLMFIAPSGPSPSGPTISTVNVLADGTVAWGGYVTVGEGAEGYVSLSGITFSVEAA